jgi:U3 small nucleolar RNA-associated protein 7
MRQNPYNAVMLLGNNKGMNLHGNTSVTCLIFLLSFTLILGVVSMYTPNMGKAVVKVLCHSGKVTSLCVDKTGHYLTTAGADNKLKIWDVRTYKELYSYNTPKPASSIDISQRGILGVGCGEVVQMWKDVFTSRQTNGPYMIHRVKGNATESIRFCPFEDIAGIGHSNGFSSVVVPGAGEPNFDSYAANPYQSNSQRREAEVHALLDKVCLAVVPFSTRVS